MILFKNYKKYYTYFSAYQSKFNFELNIILD